MIFNAQRFRVELQERGVRCLGSPYPIVPDLVGEGVHGRLASRALRRHDVFANLVEFPGVLVNSARFRLQVMADHPEAHTERAAETVAAPIAKVKAELDALRN